MSNVLSPDQLVSIANQFGSPVYIYHAEKIKEQYNKLASAFKGDVKFYYACKALSNVNVLKYIQSLGASLDCVSIHEVRLGLMAGFDSNTILYTPNCVDFEEILAAKELGVTIIFSKISDAPFVNDYSPLLQKIISPLNCIRIHFHCYCKVSYT